MVLVFSIIRLITDQASFLGERNTHYTIQHETGKGGWDAGDTEGYMFTIVGTKGETAPFDCSAARTQGATGECTMEDVPDIGNIKEVKIYNSGDNYWCFLSLTINELNFGGKCVDDYQTETLSLAGEGVEYNILHETGPGYWDAGNTGGYMFTIVGTKGETSPHDCTSKRELESTGGCTIWDDADIGEIKDVKIYNSGDNYWCFLSLSVNGLDFGGKCVDDYLTETLSVVGEGVEYNIVHETGTGTYHDGSTGGYMFTIVGSNGETSPHDCTASRALGSTGTCTIWDDADIGEIKDVKIYNSGDNYWCFDSLTVNGLEFGEGCSDDYTTEVFQLS